MLDASPTAGRFVMRSEMPGVNQDESAWITWRHRLDSLPPIQLCDSWAWGVECEKDHHATSIASDLWKLIRHYRRSGKSFDDAAMTSYCEVKGAWGLVGIGDLGYLSALRAIEKHMPEGKMLRTWHNQNFGV